MGGLGLQVSAMAEEEQVLSSSKKLEEGNGVEFNLISSKTKVLLHTSIGCLKKKSHFETVSSLQFLRNIFVHCLVTIPPRVTTCPLPLKCPGLSVANEG